MERNHTADAMRGGAALVVAIAHVWQCFIAPFAGGFPPLASLAAWSVVLFFCLSGYVIAQSIERQQTEGAFDLGRFMLARVLRIFPPLWAAVALTVAVVLVVNGLGLYGAQGYRLPGDMSAVRDSLGFTVNEVLGSLTLTYALVPDVRYLGANGPLWSLPFEFWNYVAAGLLVATLAGRRLALVGLLALVVMVLVASRSTVNPGFWSVSIVWWGGFAAAKYGKWLLARPWFVLALGLASVVAAIAWGGSQTAAYLADPYGGVGAQVFMVLGSGSVIALMLFASKLRTTPSNWLARIGGYSYTLYLTHFPIFLLSLSLFRPALLSLGAWGLVALAVASLAIAMTVAMQLARVVENRDLLRATFRKFRA